MTEMTVYASTLNWTMGEICSFEIVLRENCSMIVDWGDGEKEEQTGIQGTYLHFYHCYPKGNKAYVINVFSEKDDVISEFWWDGDEMDLKRIDTSKCPGLELLYAESLSEIDVTNNPKLKSLRSRLSVFEEIDLSNNTELEDLILNGNHKLVRLDVSSCRTLKYLDCSCCSNLKEIIIPEQPMIVDFLHVHTPELNHKSRMALLRSVKRNRKN